jgi:hypothetical protein
VGFSGIGRSTPMGFAEIVAWQPPGAGSRPVPIGSRFIGVSLQPAIPRRVAPQQSPLPLHQSPTIIAQSRSGVAINALLNLMQGCCSGRRPAFGCGVRARRIRRQPECHLYFARRVSYLSCADISCKRNIEMTPLCKIEVTHPRVLGSREVRRGGGVDEQAGVQPS